MTIADEKQNRGKFNHVDLELVKPDFESDLTDLIIELNHLRKKKVERFNAAPDFFPN